MSHAYITFLANKDVTADGVAIYPTFMQLWPTYLMIVAGALTVLLNSVVVFWRVHGTMKDLARIEIYGKYWDYALHAVNGLVWLATSMSFRLSKNLTVGGAADPDALWGYVCSETATELSKTYPQILRFWVQCNVQVCFSFLYLQ